MENIDEYIEALLKEIERDKEKGKDALYKINVPLTKRAVQTLEEYFSSGDYRIQIKKCFRCRNQWDFIIYFH